MAGQSTIVELCPQAPAVTLDNAADNECAETLLQLAMSIAPSASSAVPTPATFSVTFSSPMKTNITYSPNSGSSANSSPGYGTGFSDDMDERDSVLKNILQDHCYAGPNDEKCRSTDYPAAFRTVTDESLIEEILGDDVGVPPRWDKENSVRTQQKSTRKKSPNKRTRPYYGSCPRKNYTTSAAQSKSAIVRAAETSNMESKDKYNNFQLLLKCLVANDPMPKDEKISLDESQNVPNSMSQLGDSAAVQSKMDFEDDFENSDVEGDAHYVCPDCPKTFSKRRYLTKHVRRMHPETKIPEMKDGVATACPNCFCVIQRRNFQRHLEVCDVEMSRMKNQPDCPESSFVFCQFCGAQMKRQLLGKHLAKEHCIDRHTVQYEQEFSKFLADEENASLYPTESSNPVQETAGTSGAVEVEKPKVDVLALIVPCPKCNISISDDLLSRHMALDHNIIVDNASALAASRCSCKHSMLQAYLDGTTETKGSGSNYPCEACVQSLSTLSEHCSATVSAHSSERIALSSPISGMSSTSPVKSAMGTGSTVSAEETRMQVSLLEDTAHTLLQCAAAPVAKV